MYQFLDTEVSKIKTLGTASAASTGGVALSLPATGGVPPVDSRSLGVLLL